MRQNRLNRCGRLAAFALAATMLATSSGGAAGKAAESAPVRPAEARVERPNVILIVADDLGWADLPSYGNKVTSAPNLDRLARAGVRYTHFYAEPVCSPSRADLQSGRYSARVGITDFIPGFARPFERVTTPRAALNYPQDGTTIGGAMKQLGYATGYFGKWHLGRFEDHPGGRGYDDVFLATSQDHLVDRKIPTADVIAQRTAKFIDAHKGQPFFLMLAPTQVHTALRAHQAAIDRSRARIAKARATLPDPIYGAMIEELDTLVGQVLNELERNGLSKSTLVMFVSDNGGLENMGLGVAGRITTNAPLRGGKGTIYEGGVRVPFIARWPGKIPAGSRDDRPAAMIDLLPTFLDAGGTAKPAIPLDGRSLLSRLRQPRARIEERPLFFHYPHYHHDRPASAVIAYPWKLIDYLDDGTRRLYNLASDKGESRDVAAQNPKTVARLLTLLDRWRADVGAKLPTKNPSYDPAKAGEWWLAGDKEPIDVEAFGKEYYSPGEIFESVRDTPPPAPAIAQPQ